MSKGSRLSRLREVSVMAAVAGAVLASSQSAAANDGDAELGKRLYWEGIGADGEPIQATTTGDVAVSGEHFACVACHKPSGFGTTEGGYYVPPITGPILFNDWTPDRFQTFNERFRDARSADMRHTFQTQRGRPAYDEDSLARALREGVSANGREFDRLMPRYDIGDEDVRNLMAHLEKLAAEPPPGLDDRNIHISTIVSKDADPDARRAMLDTIEVFVDWYNERTAGNRSNIGYSTPYMAKFRESFRDWNLHVWELEGSPDTWGEQLDAYYEEQPVFASVSGLVEGPWEPVAAFCDAREMPCLFPNTELPRTNGVDYGYSIYFSRGLEVEAEALVHFLEDVQAPDGEVIQYHDAGAYGSRPAEAFESALAARLPEVSLTSQRFDALSELEAGLQSLSDRDAPADTLVIWPGADLDAVVELLNRHAPEVERIVLPSRSLEAVRAGLAEPLRERVKLVYPYEDPSAYHPRAFRVRAWMNTRRLDVTHPQLQNQTYYTMTLFQYGLEHLITRFNRDFLIEFIEHEAESHLNVGTHPQLALGPGQRFASKGAFIIELDDEETRGFRTITDWIVP